MGAFEEFAPCSHDECELVPAVRLYLAKMPNDFEGVVPIQISRQFPVK
jgi:hypothetical protein